MSLRERLRSKKEAKIKKTQSKPQQQLCEFKISIEKVAKAVNKINNVSDLGNIVQEFSKFLSTLPTENASITFSGSFDLGQRTLLNCVLSNFLEDGEKPAQTSFEEHEEDSEPTKEPSKLIKKRKSLKSKLEKADEENEIIKE